MNVLRTTLAAALALPLFAAAQPAAGPHKQLYMYQAADREQRILDGARKEKQVTVYTSLNLKDSVPITQAFEKKYGVKVELWRSSSEKVLQRAVTEARAGRFAVDAFELNGPEMEALYREGLLEEFYSPHFKTLPPAAFPKHRHYAADRFNFFTIAYNTKLVKPDVTVSSTPAQRGGGGLSGRGGNTRRCARNSSVKMPTMPATRCASSERNSNVPMTTPTRPQGSRNFSSCRSTFLRKAAMPSRSITRSTGIRMAAA